MSDRGVEFYQLVHGILSVEKKYSVKNVAALMGMNESTLCARLRDDSARVPFSADEINALIQAAPDRRFVNYLLDSSPLIAARRTPSTHDNESRDGHLISVAINADIESGHIVEDVVHGLTDGKVCHNDNIKSLTRLMM